MINKPIRRNGLRFKIRSIASLAIIALTLTTLIAPAPQTGIAHAGQLFSYLWPSKKLDSVVSDITKRYPDISHLKTAKLAEMLESDSEIILVDVREDSEFQVSHLPGAIHISPQADITQITTALKNDFMGKEVVFYCSVGERSSRMAEIAKEQLMSNGASGVYNLSGGIFAWHNEKRNLSNTKGPTDFVHPFDKHWGRLVDRQEQTRMNPGNAL